GGGGGGPLSLVWCWCFWGGGGRGGGPPPAARFRGIHVHFAQNHDQADDLIRELIRQAPAPRQLHVVSDDREVRAAARHHRCPTLSCDEFLEQLARKRRQRRSIAGENEKPQRPSALEAQHWLEEFADLDDDPDWQALFKQYDFDESPRQAQLSEGD
ncbi:MAG: NYN domain-containing protein, partial [Gemmataceae bacterium]|nr:NYN domain-containing protein [Gemmataceae bacterium]MDW8266291.1 NYN domain-containing protein [Gemmataceae bacterium]